MCIRDRYKGTNWILGEITNIFVRYNPNIPIVNDTLRDTDVNYIKVIDYMFEEEFSKTSMQFNIDFYLTKEERIDWILKVVLKEQIEQIKTQK